MKDYRITLYSDTFIWINETEGLIYNSKDMIGFSFLLDRRIKKICQELLVVSNLYSAVLSEETINDKATRSWIRYITEKYKAGYLSKPGEARKISMKPILKIIEDSYFHEWESQLGFNANLINNIHELTFHINGSKNGNNFYAKQIIYPIKSHSYLEMIDLLDFVHQCDSPFLTNINLVGDIFNYPYLNDLLYIQTKLSKNCCLHVLFEDILNSFNKIDNIIDYQNITLNIIIEDLINEDIIDHLKQIKVNHTITLLISSTENYDHLIKQLNNNYLDSELKISPIFDTTNIEFFKKNVYLNQEDLNEIQIDKREIFKNQSINSNFFGKLTIFPDGNVYTTVNLPAIGTIHDEVSKIIYNEFSEKKGWFYIREMMPCNSCIYQWLCSSPSNYELVIERPNLCHINP